MKKPKGLGAFKDLLGKLVKVPPDELRERACFVTACPYTRNAHFDPRICAGCKRDGWRVVRCDECGASQAVRGDSWTCRECKRKSK